MPQAQFMTDIEKIDTAYQACLLRRAGDNEGFERLTRSIPMPPWLAKIIKEKVGLEYFERYDCNLAEVEAEFGPDFLSK